MKFPRYFILLVSLFFAGCASHPKEVTESSSQSVALPRIATCPIDSPMVEDVMAKLRVDGIHPQADLLGTTGVTGIYVFPEESAKARKIILSLANEGKFKGLQVEPH